MDLNVEVQEQEQTHLVQHTYMAFAEEPLVANVGNSIPATASNYG